MAAVPPLEVKRAPLPYYKPWVIIRTDTGQVVGWYKSKPEADKALKTMLAGHGDTTVSPIQPTSDPLKAHESRMTHPFGDKPQPSFRPGQLTRRRIEL